MRVKARGPRGGDTSSSVSMSMSMSLAFLFSRVVRLCARVVVVVYVVVVVVPLDGEPTAAASIGDSQRGMLKGQHKKALVKVLRILVVFR